VIGFLRRTGLTATVASEGTYRVLAPFWRGDVLHECDVLEDIAICYGFTRIVPQRPPTTTVGGRVRMNKFTDFLRQELAQAQFNEALNFALCSRADVTTNILNEDESKLIRIENAKTKEFQTGRTTLLPGLLRTICENKSQPLPYRLFEAGDCIVTDPSTDTGARNLRRLAAAITDEVQEGSRKGLFSVVHGALDLVLKKANLIFGKDYRLVPTTSPFFFPGQQFLVEVGGEELGSLGVVHPVVLGKFGWAHPTAMWEIDVAVLEKHYTKSFQ
jgi:phenylalanyl-tRNA synthetase beta chain